MVNSRAGIYLTDFVESTFVGEIAKNRGFCGGEKIEARPLHPPGIYHAKALRPLSGRSRPARRCDSSKGFIQHKLG